VRKIRTRSWLLCRQYVMLKTKFEREPESQSSKEGDCFVARGATRNDMKL
jgi:hypothetical protein